MGAEEIIPRHRLRLFERLAERAAKHPEEREALLMAMKKGHVAGSFLAPDIFDILQGPVERLVKYYKQGHYILLLGRDTLPIRLMLAKRGVPVKTLGVSSSTRELAPYMKLAEYDTPRSAFRTFKSRYPKEYASIKRVLSRITEKEKVVVVDTGYEGRQVYPIVRILKELGKEPKLFLVMGKPEFRAEVYYKEKMKKLDPKEASVFLSLIETELIKPHTKYYEINRARTLHEVPPEKKIELAKRLAAWLAFVDYVDKILRRRRGCASRRRR